jgi:hypothetical protein
MKISEEFPSQYIKASDLGGRDIRVTMGRVEREKIGTDNKLVLYFKGKEKGLVLNKTNAATIGDAYGDDTEDWYDQPLILFSVKTDYQGKVVDATRCRVPTARDNRDVAPRRVTGGVSDNLRDDPISSGPPAGHPANEAPPNDDIPF